MSGRQEIDTSFFLEYLWRKHRRIRTVVPIVKKGSKDLLHVEINSDSELEKSNWGIPEPVDHSICHFPTQMDMVLIPMLSFDLNGNRLGYGAGFYDRFLQLTRPACRRIGLCFEMGLTEEGLPAESHDVPLDFVVTEKGIYDFRPNKKP